MPMARSTAARTLGSGPCTVSLLASLIAPAIVLPSTYAGSSANSGRRRAVTSTAYVRPVYAVLRGGSGSRGELDGQAPPRAAARPALSPGGVRYPQEIQGGVPERPNGTHC